MIERNRFSEEQIIGILKRASSGHETAELSRRLGVSDVTLYKRRSKYVGMKVSHTKRLKAPEAWFPTTRGELEEAVSAL